MGVRSDLLSYRRNGLVAKIKHKANLLDLSIVSNDDFTGLAIPGPKLIHAATIFLPSLTLPNTPCLLSNYSVEKLGTSCAGPSIHHGLHARTHVFQDEILIIQFLPIDELASWAMMAWEDTTQAQKSQNNSGKAGDFITKPFLPTAQSKSPLLSLELCKQLQGDSAQGLTIYGNVQEHMGLSLAV